MASLATRANSAGAAQVRAHIYSHPACIPLGAQSALPSNFCSPDRAGSQLTRRGSNPRPLDPKVSGVYPWLGRPGEGGTVRFNVVRRFHPCLLLLVGARLSSSDGCGWLTAR